MPKPIHIALTFDDNFWAPAYAVMRSVCLTTRRRDITFHLLHDGLSEAHRADLETVRSEFGIAIVHHELAEHAEFNRVCRSLPVDARLHTVMYARLLLHLFVPKDAGRVIYLDCDTLVIAPIERLYEAEMDGQPIAAVQDAMRLFVMKGRDMRAKGTIFNGADDYFNSGVMLIDLEKFASANPPAHIEAFKAQGLLEHLYFDQDMLNLMFKGQWKALPWRFNITDPREAHQAMDPYIVHYTGKARPWLLYANVAFRRSYRHVMTNDLFYRYMRHRWARWWKRLPGRLAGR